MMKQRDSLKFSFALFILLWTMVCGLSTLYADTIYMHDGKEAKGIVVEDYNDRIVLSTVDGEVTIMKRDIRELYFDNEEDNLIKLGEQARDRRDYAKAIAYYDKAYKLNPASKVARDGITFLQGYLFRRDELRKEDDVKRREEFERYGTIVPTDKSESDALKAARDRLDSTIGIGLKHSEGSIEVTGVEPDSPAEDAGIVKGDLLVAIWGRLTGYMSLKEAMSLLLEKPTIEIKCVIERKIEIKINHAKGRLSNSNDLIGVIFKMEFDGLTVNEVRGAGPSYEAGVKKGDLVTAIDGKSMRYTPLKKAVEIIRDSKEPSVNLTIRREVTIWRRPER